MKRPAESATRVTIELFGVPRVRAGLRACEVTAASAGEAMAALEAECPALAGCVLDDGWPLPAYRLSLNGQSFITDRSTRLAPGDSLLLLAADAGG